MYQIIYKGETVDTAESYDVAVYLQKEYSIAFKSSEILIEESNNSI